MRDITISPALNGWIVRVGCQVVVFQDLSALLAELGNYINNPKGTEERFLSNAKNTIPANVPPQPIVDYPQQVNFTGRP